MRPAVAPRSLRRAGNLLITGVITGAVVSSALTVAGPAPAARAAADPAAAAATAAWLESRLVDGLVEGPFGKEYGTSADAAIALDAVGGHDATVEQISDAVAAEVGSYVDYDYEYDEVVYTGTSAGSTAKAAVLAQVAGDDSGDFGGQDLVGKLAGMVADEAPITGRIVDAAFADGEPDPTGDYANAFGQTYAARALLTAGHPAGGPVVDYLLDQQCSAGFFRLYFPGKVGDQTCDGAEPAEPSPPVDTTAFVVIHLHEHADGDPELAAALDEAVAWIRGAQAADGSFDGGSATEGPNANSTGLAGWALHVAGETEAAEDAATWLRARQVPGTRCDGRLAAEAGAIAYDQAAYDAGVADGIGVTATQWQLVAIQALPALLAAPAARGGLRLGKVPAFLDAGRQRRVAVTGLAPGERGCVRIGASTVAVVGDADGAVTAKIAVPARSRRSLVEASVVDDTVARSAVVLAGKRLPVRLRAKVAPTRKQRVVVRGLWKGERVVVRDRGKVVAKGRARANGRFVATYRVVRKPGRHRVVVQGQFGDRRNQASYRVR
ncbi:prenyltransferase/squalene oxidase repeat-containing protein [Nocardioides sp. TF02-7]|uniref:prenyltransferase/squalene oxidase repeat-containing protein n=1 Tax=Nocardioides sp. TF02-7 TaxID=2917724 RepID=UPI001F067B54|nr:prenyltransferase/squalene oxidase repeat-containing protein [Nocardioides sp. TF02-7]UMG93136.1 terpene cyclase/mutase family protein [Nocardioides sp. TF02-7]